MNLITIAIVVLTAFVAVWFLFVVPAEKRHHQRKLDNLRKRIEKRQSATDDEQKYGDPGNSETREDNQ